MSNRPLRQDQIALLWASVASVAAWVIPVLNWVALPLEYLNTHAHEMCHAITSVLTGGRVEEITVEANGSGLTLSWGGMNALISSAGYVGATLIGVLIILFSRNAKGARWSLRFLAVALAASSLLWLRAHDGSQWVGLASAYGWVALLFGLAWFLPDKWALFTATFVGLQQCLHSLLSLLMLLNISMFTEAHSDAMNMEQMTKVPAIVWALGWSAFSLFLMAITAKGAFKTQA